MIKKEKKMFWDFATEDCHIQFLNKATKMLQMFQKALASLFPRVMWVSMVCTSSGRLYSCLQPQSCLAALSSSAFGQPSAEKM